jgi:hypothetical protein
MRQLFKATCISWGVGCVDVQSNRDPAVSVLFLLLLLMYFAQINHFEEQLLLDENNAGQTFSLSHKTQTKTDTAAKNSGPQKKEDGGCLP